MDQINGKSGSVAGVNPSTLDFLARNVTSYGETITGSGTVVAGLETSFGANSLSKLGVSLENAQQVSLSRTVTNTNGSQSATVAYALAAQTSTQPTTDIFGTSTSDQSSQQVSFTRTYNLSQSDLADPERALTEQGRWLTPNEVQQQIQTQVLLGSTLSLPQSGSAGDGLVRTTTITATLRNPGASDLTRTTQAFQSNRAHPASSNAQEQNQVGSNFSGTTQQSTVDNNTVTVGGDWPVSGQLMISKPVGARAISPSYSNSTVPRGVVNRG